MLRPVWFCVDSGAPHGVIDSRFAQELKLRNMSSDSVTGTGEGKIAVTNLDRPLVTKPST